METQSSSWCCKMTPEVPGSPLAARVAVLETCFRHIAKTRMQGLGLCHPSLRVRAVGFVANGSSALGVLVTPWFMNLVRLPLQREDDVQRVGVAQLHEIGEHRFEFIGMHEAAQLGSYEACSLFSPMFEFENAAAAEATALSVMAQLQSSMASAAVPHPAVQETMPHTLPDSLPHTLPGSLQESLPPAVTRPVPTRRSFLLPRGVSHG